MYRVKDVYGCTSTFAKTHAPTVTNVKCCGALFLSFLNDFEVVLTTQSLHQPKQLLLVLHSPQLVLFS